MAKQSSPNYRVVTTIPKFSGALHGQWRMAVVELRPPGDMLILSKARDCDPWIIKWAGRASASPEDAIDSTYPHPFERAGEKPKEQEELDELYDIRLHFEAHAIIAETKRGEI